METMNFRRTALGVVSMALATALLSGRAFTAGPVPPLDSANEPAHAAPLAGEATR